MTLEDNYNLDNIRNNTKELVYQRVEELLKESDDVCSCETCVLDLVHSCHYVTPLVRNREELKDSCAQNANYSQSYSTCNKNLGE